MQLEAWAAAGLGTGRDTMSDRVAYQWMVWSIPQRPGPVIMNQVREIAFLKELLA